jgi:alcohol dehydrogenase (cytochrome c)
MKTNLIRFSLLAALAASTAAHAGNVTDAMIDNDGKSTSDVLSWGIGPQGQRFSPLTQVNTKTVSKLVPAWSFSFGGEKQRGQESQPLGHGYLERADQLQEGRGLPRRRLHHQAAE